MVVLCPNCSRKLRVPDNLGRITAKCPLCNHSFTCESGLATGGASSNEKPKSHLSKRQQTRSRTKLVKFLIVSVAVVLLAVYLVYFFSEK
jgi:predicted nucleic acid-binding Zn ribbon protein